MLVSACITLRRRVLSCPDLCCECIPYLSDLRAKCTLQLVANPVLRHVALLRFVLASRQRIRCWTMFTACPLQDVTHVMCVCCKPSLGAIIYLGTRSKTPVGVTPARLPYRPCARGACACSPHGGSLVRHIHELFPPQFPPEKQETRDQLGEGSPLE